VPEILSFDVFAIDLAGRSLRDGDGAADARGVCAAFGVGPPPRPSAVA